MYKYLPITDVYAREILDSRGNPKMNSADGQVYRRALPQVSLKHWNYVMGKKDTPGLVWNGR